MIRRAWRRLAECSEPDCTASPTRLGRCDVHAQPYDPGPDEYWGDTDTEER